LLAWLGAEEITLTFLPTPMAETLLLEDWAENKKLRAVLTGGERLHRRRAPGLAGIDQSLRSDRVQRCGDRRPGEPRSESNQAPPIGRPIANTRAYAWTLG